MSGKSDECKKRKALQLRQLAASAQARFVDHKKSTAKSLLWDRRMVTLIAEHLPPAARTSAGCQVYRGETERYLLLVGRGLLGIGRDHGGGVRHDEESGGVSSLSVQSGPLGQL